MQLRVHFNNELEWTLTKKYKPCVKDDYLNVLSSPVLQEKLLVKFSRPYHTPMKKTFADNQQKLDSHTTSALYILNDWL